MSLSAFFRMLEGGEPCVKLEKGMELCRVWYVNALAFLLELERDGNSEMTCLGHDVLRENVGGVAALAGGAPKHCVFHSNHGKKRATLERIIDGLLHERMHDGNSEPGCDQLAHDLRVVAFELKLASDRKPIENFIHSLPQQRFTAG